MVLFSIVAEPSRRPPPLSPPLPVARLPLMVELVIVTSLVLAMPPPVELPVAVLFEIVLLSTISDAPSALLMPPPNAAVLPVMWHR